MVASAPCALLTFFVLLTLRRSPRGRRSPTSSTRSPRRSSQRPTTPRPTTRTPRRRFKAKRFDDVIHKVKIGVARIPTYSQGYYWLAYAYRKKREWADAADYYRRFITLNPTKTDPYFGLGASLEGLGDNKGAIAAYEKYVALEKAPEKQHFVDLAKAELGKLDPSRSPAPIPVAPPLPIATQPPPATNSAPSTDAAVLRTTAEQLHARRQARRGRAAPTSAPSPPIRATSTSTTISATSTSRSSATATRRTAFREAVVARSATTRLGWYNLAHALRKGDQKQRGGRRLPPVHAASSPTIRIRTMASARRSRRSAT